jgi:hypothetical protein
MIPKSMNKTPNIIIAASFLACLILMPFRGYARAFDFKDIAEIGIAYLTHLGFHEVGHQLVADEVGADSHKINFFTSKKGKFYPGLSLYKGIPEESRLPYALGGERMAGLTFEYALQSYRRQPTMFNKSLMFFSCVDFLGYTLLANYVYPDNDMLDPNLIRTETGLSKEMLLSMVTARTLLNAYRVINKDANFSPMILLDKKSATFAVRFEF